MDAHAAKQELRRSSGALAPPDAGTRARILDHVARWLRRRRPSLVVGYIAMGEEIDVAPLVGLVPQISFALTRTAPGVTLTVHPFDSPRETHPYGFDQPAAQAPVLDPADVDVVLVPGVAFDRGGGRLGRGAGYYDRFLAGLQAETVALTTQSRIVDRVPAEPHDVAMDWIATEAGVHRAARP